MIKTVSEVYRKRFLRQEYFALKGRKYMLITSRENKIFKNTKLLKTARGRNEKGMFIIEGLRSVHDAIDKGVAMEYLLLKEGISAL